MLPKSKRVLLWDRSVSIRYCSVSPHILTVIVGRYDMCVRAGLPDSGDEVEMEVVTQHPGMPALGDVECATCTAYAGGYTCPATAGARQRSAAATVSRLLTIGSN